MKKNIQRSKSYFIKSIRRYEYKFNFKLLKFTPNKIKNSLMLQKLFNVMINEDEKDGVEIIGHLEEISEIEHKWNNVLKILNKYN